MSVPLIYLDANASSRLRMSARASIESRIAADAANASSVHSRGRRLRADIRKARQAVLELMGLDDSSARVVFTSGGTEANHLLLESLLGGPQLMGKYPAHIIMSAVEHAALRDPILRLKQYGWEITEAKCDRYGRVSVESILGQVKSNTALVACMAVNNETGAIQPVVEIARRLREQKYPGVIVSDMVQALVKTDLSAAELFAAGVDAVSISGHKIGAPAGVGAVAYSKAVGRCSEISPAFVGGAQEEFLRAGTENALGICAFGAVADELLEHQDEYRKEMQSLRELLWTELSRRIDFIHRLTPPAQEAAVNTLLIAFEDCRGDDLVVCLDLLGVAVSTGAACSSGKQGRSHVVDSMDIEDRIKDSVIRISLDWDCTPKQIEEVGLLVEKAVTKMRGCEPNQVKSSQSDLSDSKASEPNGNSSKVETRKQNTEKQYANR